MFRERPSMGEAPGSSAAGNTKSAWTASVSWMPSGIAGEERGSALTFGVLTIEIQGSDILPWIWRERCPVLMTESEALEWLDREEHRPAGLGSLLIAFPIPFAVILSGIESFDEPWRQRQVVDRLYLSDPGVEPWPCRSQRAFRFNYARQALPKWSGAYRRPGKPVSRAMWRPGRTRIGRSKLPV